MLLIVFCMPAGFVKAASGAAASGTAVIMKVGSKSFECVFYDNDTANALLKSMPVKYKMSELNGNEKYRYLNKDYPTNEKKVKKIKAGDIMLFGSDCLVVFYKSFTTSYEYTRVGRVTNVTGLKKAVGKGKVTIQFSKKKVITLSRKSLTMEKGQTKTIKLKGASAKKVTWSSTNSKVATVSKGKIKAKKVGKVTIIATYKNKKYKCKVTVKAASKVMEPEVTEPESAEPTEPTEPGSTEPIEPTDPTEPESAEPTEPTEPGTTEPIDPTEPEQPAVETKLMMKIGDRKVQVEWENNESVAALKELVKEEPLTIQMSMYGGFEQVGSLGTSLPRNDVQTTTSPGDIMLYSGNQIVVFYGSNSWAYTKLGNITDCNAEELTALLGSGNVTLTISAE